MAWCRFAARIWGIRRGRRSEGSLLSFGPEAGPLAGLGPPNFYRWLLGKQARQPAWLLQHRAQAAGETPGPSPGALPLTPRAAEGNGKGRRTTPIHLAFDWVEWSPRRPGWGQSLRVGLDPGEAAWAGSIRGAQQGTLEAGGVCPPRLEERTQPVQGPR